MIRDQSFAQNVGSLVILLTTTRMWKRLSRRIKGIKKSRVKEGESERNQRYHSKTRRLKDPWNNLKL